MEGGIAAVLFQCHHVAIRFKNSQFVVHLAMLFATVERVRERFASSVLETLDDLRNRNKCGHPPPLPAFLGICRRFKRSFAPTFHSRFEALMPRIWLVENKSPTVVCPRCVPNAFNALLFLAIHGCFSKANTNRVQNSSGDSARVHSLARVRKSTRTHGPQAVRDQGQAKAMRVLRIAPVAICADILWSGDGDGDGDGNTEGGKCRGGKCRGWKTPRASA